MADHATRRARECGRRAAKFTEQAQRFRDAADRRHLLNLAEGYTRAGDQMKPPPLVQDKARPRP
jgi:hypothetical protein